METTPLDDSSQHLYEALADHVADMIYEGTLAAGERIPSIRRLSRQFSVSKTTVQEAYRLLEDRGLVEARPRSGYFVRPAHLRRPSVGYTLPEPSAQTPPLKARFVDGEDLHMRMLAEAGTRGAVEFGAAIPSPEFLPAERLARELGHAARHSPVAMTCYQTSPGLEELRVQIARRALDAGLSFGPEDVIVTSGATEALQLSLRAVCRPGDTVAVESPTYYLVVELLECLGLRALEIETDPRDGMSVEALSDCLDAGTSVAAVFIVPNASNPLGSIMPDDNKRALARLCAERDIALIEDDVYGELYFGDRRRPLSLGATDSHDRFFWCGSFSKSLAPGFRVGWLATGPLRERVAKIQSITTLAGPTPTQMAVARFLKGGGYDRHLNRLRRTYEEHVRLVSRLVAEAFPAGTCATRPQGGHVLWVEMPEQVDAVLLAKQAIEHGISIAPGPLFTPSSSRFQNCIRLNCAISWSKRAEEAIERLGALAASQIE